MTEEFQKLIQRAEEALVVSAKLLKDKYFSHSASKSYYSMFYASQALLKSHGIQVTKHSAVEAMLGQNFSKTGKIDSKFHRMLIEANRVRNLADYAIDDEIIESVASQKLNDAKEFVAQIKKVLNIP